MIISFDPGHKRVAWASWDQGSFQDFGYISREDLLEFRAVLVEMALPCHICLVEDQYIKRVAGSKLQTAVAAAAMKVARASAEIETIFSLHKAEVIRVHPRTWQGALLEARLSAELKKEARALALKLINQKVGSDIADAVCILQWYLTVGKEK